MTVKEYSLKFTQLLIYALTMVIDSRAHLKVFPKDLLGVPAKREIDFAIDLLPDTQLISNPPYKMFPPEFKELKDQLKDLLGKGFIKPNISPMGSPILFMRKKNGSYRINVHRLLPTEKSHNQE
ncbi:hypothetical protein MTR67_019098 [Solanum verrucosum]|uniref:Reverse transcriptase domain-containing protein n=1 Tax=Solanum verrucosum TaxID=315347 RepID=A0AAF0QNU8_SOLVR|nr:hypothetical protein MTR67_019098 [Solanum verrucosum]